MVLVPQYCLNPNRTGRSSTSGGKRAYAASDAKYRNAQEADFAKCCERPRPDVGQIEHRRSAATLDQPFDTPRSILNGRMEELRTKRYFAAVAPISAIQAFVQRSMNNRPLVGDFHPPRKHLKTGSMHVSNVLYRLVASKHYQEPQGQHQMYKEGGCFLCHVAFVLGRCNQNTDRADKGKQGFEWRSVAICIWCPPAELQGAGYLFCRFFFC